MQNPQPLQKSLMIVMAITETPLYQSLTVLCPIFSPQLFFRRIIRWYHSCEMGDVDEVGISHIFGHTITSPGATAPGQGKGEAIVEEATISKGLNLVYHDTAD